MVRHLALPVPDERLRAWADKAAERHEGYTIETYVDEFPDELAESLCLLMGQLAVDAPTGLVDFEEEDVTTERLKERYATAAAMGRSLYETVALAPDGTVAAQSTLAVAKGESPTSSSGAPSCTASTAATGSGWRSRSPTSGRCRTPTRTRQRITTQNAETNDFMVNINKEIGFEAVEDSMEWIKRL